MQSQSINALLKRGDMILSYITLFSVGGVLDSVVRAMRSVDWLKWPD